MLFVLKRPRGKTNYDKVEVKIFLQEDFQEYFWQHGV